MRSHDPGKDISGSRNTRVKISGREGAKLSFKERLVIMCKWRMRSRSPDSYCGLNMTSGKAVQAKGGSEVKGTQTR